MAPCTNHSCFFWIACSLFVTEMFSVQSIVAKQVQDSSRVAYDGIRTILHFQSADPDDPRFQISKIGGRWSNMVGGRIDIFQQPIGKHGITVSLTPFVEIHDFNADNDFSWELWRGNLGINTSMALNNLFHIPYATFNQLIVDIGYFHESDHATTGNFQDEFLDVYGWREGSFGSYEYIKMKSNLMVEFDNNWSVSCVMGTRIFPHPIERGAGRRQKYSLSFEVSVNKFLTEWAALWSSAYYEFIQTDFVSSDEFFRIPFDKGKLLYRRVELGIVFKLTNFASMTPYFEATNSNGRGLDFLKTYSDFGWGIRFIH